MVKGQRLEVIQGQGQIIFVPSGWHHQVINLVSENMCERMFG